MKRRSHRWRAQREPPLLGVGPKAERQMDRRGRGERRGTQSRAPVASDACPRYRAGDVLAFPQRGRLWGGNQGGTAGFVFDTPVLVNSRGRRFCFAAAAKTRFKTRICRDGKRPAAAARGGSALRGVLQREGILP